MANLRFTELPAIGSAALSNILAMVESNTSYQVTQQQVLNLFRDNLVLNNAGNPNFTVAGTKNEFCYDTTNSDLYICTTTGSAATAVWTRVGANLIDPDQGGTGVASPTASTLPVANGSSAFNFLGPLTNGQLLIGSTGVNPVPATLTAGTNVSIVNGAGSITINCSGSASFIWIEVTGTTQLMSVERGYIANNVSQVVFTLPVTAAVGTRVSVIGKGAGGWKIGQNAGQTINLGSTASTTGVTGYLESTNQFDSIDLICITANTNWNTWSGPQGSITVA